MLLLRRWRLRYVEISYDAMRTEGEDEARQLAPLDNDDAASVPLTPFPEKEETAGEDEDDYLTVHDDDMDARGACD